MFRKGFISNIFLVEFVHPIPSQLSSSKIVIKFYPEDSASFMRIHAQLNNLFAGQAGLSPKVLLVRPDILVMQYMEGSRELTQQDDQCSVIRETIARKLAQFHSLQVPIVRNHQRDKIHRVFDEFFSDELNRTITFGHIKNCLEKLNLKNISTGNLRAEANYVRDLLLERESQFPVVFAHRDFNHNNILIERNSKSIHFIDFDLSWYFYRGADIGRYLLDCKQPEQFTDNELISDAEMLEFINWYSEQNCRLYGTSYLNGHENLPYTILVEAKHFILFYYLVDTIFCMWRASVMYDEHDPEKGDQFLVNFKQIRIEF